MATLPGPHGRRNGEADFQERVTPGDLAPLAEKAPPLQAAPSTSHETLRSERLPVTEERVHLEKRTAQGDAVRVRTIVEEEPVDLHEQLVREAVEVERTPINRVVDSAPETRREGDVLIVPVLEERLVVRKELVLVEEVRLRLTRSIEPVEVVATRRVMRAVVERESSSPSTSKGTDR